MKRISFGLAAGLAVWGSFDLLLRAIKFWDYEWSPGFLSFLLFVLIAVSYVLLGGAVAGYIAKKRGLMLGGVIGVAQTLVWLVPLMRLGWLSRFTASRWVQEGFTWVVIYIAPGVLGGYLGQRLARFRRRPRSNTDRGIAKRRRALTVAHSRLRIALDISLICGGTICLVGSILAILIIWSPPDVGPKTIMIRTLSQLAVLGLLALIGAVRHLRRYLR